MKKFYTLLFALIACALTSITANAKLIELGELQLDTDYQVASDFNSYIGSFTAPSSGTLVATSTDTYTLLPYYERLDDMETMGNPVNYSLDNPYGAKKYHFNVTEGTTYYFYLDFSMSSFTFRMTMDGGNEIKIDNISPEEGSLFSISSGGMISIQFNRSVNLNTTAQVISGSNEESVTINGQNNMYSIEIKEVIVKWLNEGTVQSGDKFIVRISDITAADDASVVYGTDGVAEIEYTIAPMPIQLIGSTNTSGTFKSYYMSDDPTAIVTLIFDGEVSSANASLSFGTTEVEGDYYMEELTPVIEGNTIKIDLSGKSRTLDMMVASGNNYNNMVLSIGKVLDKSGQYAYSSGQGSLGSFAFLYETFEVVTANVISEFIPAPESTLDANTTESIEIWVTDEAKLSYDGIQFKANYLETPLVVVDFKKEADPYDPTAAILTVPVPGELFTATTEETTDGKEPSFVVTLNNLRSADGIDHTNDVSAIYYVKLSDAVEKVFGDETTEFTVFNTQGILVLHTTNREELRNLPQGIYIINGVKFLIAQ